MSLSRRLWAEGLGTAFLLAVVVGSGIMAERLSGENLALALLANAIVTGAGLLALILTFSHLSGAHFNPVVTMVMWLRRELSGYDATAYALIQILGAFFGVAMAHGMFDLPIFTASQQIRTGMPQLWSEFVATFGLLMVIIGCSREQPKATPYAVAAYITSAYWFTASTSFANPAVTMARAATDTFAGIAPANVSGFIAAQIMSGLIATWVARKLF